MAGKTTKKSAKIAKKAGAKRVVAKAAKRPSRIEVGSASKRIDRRVQELGDWRGKTLQRVREIITEADPEIIEEWKWNTPVWSRNGLICTGEAYKNIVKMTFAKGASLKDPSRLFNSSLEGKVRRAIDIREGDKIDQAALNGLVRAAVALNFERKGSSTAASWSSSADL
jgi:hypothetical protein